MFGSLAQVVKELYESNPDTNAFTDGLQDALAAHAASVSAPGFQRITADGVWPKPPTARMALIELIAAGGQGGHGTWDESYSSITQHEIVLGGEPGQRVLYLRRAADLAASVDVVIGAGGGTGVSASGGDTIFGTLRAIGGGGGSVTPAFDITSTAAGMGTIENTIRAYLASLVPRLLGPSLAPGHGSGWALGNSFGPVPGLNYDGLNHADSLDGTGSGGSRRHADGYAPGGGGSGERLASGTPGNGARGEARIWTW